MGDKTKIEWSDATWNPVTGCTEVSPGCDNCYAKVFAERWRGTPGHYFEDGFDVVLRPDKLELPLRWKKPRKVFVNSMSDLFHDDVPDDYIAQVFAVMALARDHTFQLLTKRHGRMRSLLNDWEFVREVGTHIVAREVHHGYDFDFPADGTDWWPLRNVWLGVSVENQQWADIRVPALLATPAAVRFLSMEPLLGRVTFRWAKWAPMRDAWHLDGLKGIDWVIAGGESGHGARPMQVEWIRTLRDECAEARVPFFMKQAGVLLAREWGVGGKGDDPSVWPEPFPREFPA